MTIRTNIRCPKSRARPCSSAECVRLATSRSTIATSTPALVDQFLPKPHSSAAPSTVPNDAFHPSPHGVTTQPRRLCREWGSWRCFGSSAANLSIDHPISSTTYQVFIMAPGLTATETVPFNGVNKAKVQAPRSIFPDGIKTSGQHPPNYDEIRPFEDFPKSIDAPTLWKAEDYKDNRERWVHQFSPEEIVEMSTAADDFKASGMPLTGISKVC